MHRRHTNQKRRLVSKAEAQPGASRSVGGRKRVHVAIILASAEWLPRAGSGLVTAELPQRGRYRVDIVRQARPPAKSFLAPKRPERPM